MKKFAFVVIALVCVVFSWNIACGQGYCYDCMFNGYYWNCASHLIQGYATCAPIAGGLMGCDLAGSCNGGGSCFLGEMEISTPGGLRKICDLKVGDLVNSLGEEGGLQIATVLNIHKSESWSYLCINNKINVTDSHPFFDGKEWVKAKDLLVGGQLTMENGETIMVSSIERIDKGVRVYNMSVSGDHTFFAEGALVHNKPPRPGS